MTMGDKGCLAVSHDDPNDFTYVECPKVDVVDTTVSWSENRETCLQDFHMQNLEDILPEDACKLY